MICPEVVDTNTRCPTFAAAGAASKRAAGMSATPAMRTVTDAPAEAEAVAKPTGFKRASVFVASALRTFGVPALLLNTTRSPALRGSCAVAVMSTVPDEVDGVAHDSVPEPLFVSTVPEAPADVGHVVALPLALIWRFAAAESVNAPEVVDHVAAAAEVNVNAPADVVKLDAPLAESVTTPPL